MQELFSWKPRKPGVPAVQQHPSAGSPLPSYTAGRTEFTRRRMTGTPNGDSPNILAKSYTIVADISSFRWWEDDRHRRWPLRRLRAHLLKGKPVFTYNLSGCEFRWEGGGTHTGKYYRNSTSRMTALSGRRVQRLAVRASRTEHRPYHPVLLRWTTFDIGPTRARRWTTPTTRYHSLHRHDQRF
jgi:hypothetical protein